MAKNFTTSKEIGSKGEKIAQDFLISKGYKILETNFRYSRQAEIDIIALKDNILHFIEVKTRTSTFFGTPFEAIDKRKISQILKGASFYLQNSKKRFKKTQLDAIGILFFKDEYKISFIENISI